MMGVFKNKLKVQYPTIGLILNIRLAGRDVIEKGNSAPAY